MLSARLEGFRLRRAIRRCALVLCVLIAASAAAPAAFAALPSKPNFLHGVGRMVGGVVIEIPKTILDATFSGPPVVGTLIGLLAAPAKAAQAIFEGFEEASAAFDPWGTKRHEPLPEEL